MAESFFGPIAYARALITDVADGFVARKLGQVTNVGGLLDHSSDALLVLSGLVSPPLASFHGLYPFSYSSHSLSMFGTLVAQTSTSARLINRQAKRHDVFRVCCPSDCSGSVFLPIPNAAATSYLAWGLVLSTLISIADRLTAMRQASRVPNS